MRFEVKYDDDEINTNAQIIMRINNTLNINVILKCGI